MRGLNGPILMEKNRMLAFQAIREFYDRVSLEKPSQAPRPSPYLLL
jgi:hypothetical protein